MSNFIVPAGVDTIPSVLNVDGIKPFFKWLAHILGNGFHPDTRFSDYEGEHGRIFTDQQADVLEIEMNFCFRLCEESDVDIYEIALSVISL